ncbi:MAG: CHAT domain-containing protein [Coleofasciculus sp. C2-GNP5-27]
MNHNHPLVTTVLLLAANPKGTSPLRLDEEIREIEEGFQRSQQRDRFRFIPKMAVRSRDVYRAMLDYKPQIVHFCGHGAGEKGLALENETGNIQLVSGEVLADLFKLFAKQLDCVLLNACYSEIQANAISQHINYVIGSKQAIGDTDAIKFAVGFYDALGAGESFDFAYEIGCVAMAIDNIPKHLTPVIKKKSADFRQTVVGID